MSFLDGEDRDCGEKLTGGSINWDDLVGVDVSRALEGLAVGEFFWGDMDLARSVWLISFSSPRATLYSWCR